MLGYLDTLEATGVTITLAGQVVNVDRARLGLHLRLGRLLDDFEEAPGSPEMAEAIRGYVVQAVGVSAFEALGLEVSQAHPVEILRAFALLREANSWQLALAFMKDAGPKKEPEPYDYPGRNWAWVVHKLASRYGWTRDYIFSLYPEEAAVYLQEILVSEQDEKEWQYSLSELAYVYDSVTKRSRFQPLARPSWMLNYELPKPVRVLKSYLPFGVVDLNNNPVTYH